jgi:hypothetical protein
MATIKTHCSFADFILAYFATFAPFPLVDPFQCEATLGQCSARGKEALPFNTQQMMEQAAAAKWPAVRSCRQYKMCHLYLVLCSYIIASSLQMYEV